MRLKKILWTVFKAMSVLFIALFIVFKCTLMTVENKIIDHYSDAINTANDTANDTVNDTAIIHFIHGSIVLTDDCIYARPRMGGLLGGHVEIEINDHVYGFRLSKLPVHIFVDNHHFNSQFEVNTKAAWLKRTKYEKMTSVYLPINQNQKTHLQALLVAYLLKSPYDYAFFGKRCASATAEILSQSGIFTPLSNIENSVAFVSPRPLRNTLLALAAEKKLLVIEKKGVDCRYWE